MAYQKKLVVDLSSGVCVILNYFFCHVGMKVYSLYIR